MLAKSPRLPLFRIWEGSSWQVCGTLHHQASKKSLYFSAAVLQLLSPLFRCNLICYSLVQSGLNGGGEGGAGKGFPYTAAWLYTTTAHSGRLSSLYVSLVRLQKCMLKFCDWTCYSVVCFALYFPQGKIGQSHALQSLLVRRLHLSLCCAV